MTNEYTTHEVSGAQPEQKEEESDHELLLKSLNATLDQKIIQQSGGTIPPLNLGSHPQIKKRFVSAFDDMRTNASVLVNKHEYEKALALVNDEWGKLKAIAKEVHPTTCVEKDAAAQWFTPVITLLNTIIEAESDPEE